MTKKIVFPDDHDTTTVSEESLIRLQLIAERHNWDEIVLDCRTELQRRQTRREL